MGRADIIWKGDRGLEGLNVGIGFFWTVISDFQRKYCKIRRVIKVSHREKGQRKDQSRLITNAMDMKNTEDIHNEKISNFERFICTVLYLSWFLNFLIFLVNLLASQFYLKKDLVKNLDERRNVEIYICRWKLFFLNILKTKFWDLNILFSKRAMNKKCSKV